MKTIQHIGIDLLCHCFPVEPTFLKSKSNPNPKGGVEQFPHNGNEVASLIIKFLES